MTSNIYNFGLPNYNKFWIDNVSKNHLNETLDTAHYNSYTLKYVDSYGSNTFNIKPLIYSEIDPIIVGLECPNNEIEMNRHLWQGLFSGLAGSYSWQLRDRKSNYEILDDMKSFISVVNFEDHWHPGASKLDPQYLIPYGWHYNKNYSKRMIGKNENGDLSYLRSGDGKLAIGVLTNRTYNVYSAANCFDDTVNNNTSWTMINSMSPVKTGNGIGGEKLKLKGMNFGNYVIDYFYPSNPDSVVASSNDWGPIVEIDFPDDLGVSGNDYIILFKARRSNTSWYPTADNDSLGQLNKIVHNDKSNEEVKTYVYPVPSEDLLNISTDVSGSMIVITSVDGRSIENIKLNSRQLTIDISNYYSGTYILTFIMDQEVYDIKKFVKL